MTCAVLYPTMSTAEKPPHFDNCRSDDADMPESEDGMKQLRERVQIGTDGSGKPLYKWATGNNRQELFISAAHILIESGQIVAPAQPREDGILFNDYALDWLNSIYAPLHENQRVREVTGILKNYVLPFFEGKRIKEIRHRDIASYFAQPCIQELANSTADNHGEHLNNIFGMAVEDDILNKNPVGNYKKYLPKRKKQREPLTQEQACDILNNLDKLRDEDRLFMSLLMYTGCRRGEALALQVRDIDPLHEQVHIWKSVKFECNKPVVGETKTKNSNRTIPIVPGFPYWLIAGMEPDSFILGGDMPWTETKLKRAEERISKTINLYGATPHIFRHTYVTLAIMAGVDMKTVQGLAGHATSSTTMNIYAHIVKEQVLQAGGQLKGLYDPAV